MKSVAVVTLALLASASAFTAPSMATRAVGNPFAKKAAPKAAATKTVAKNPFARGKKAAPKAAAKKAAPAPTKSRFGAKKAAPVAKASAVSLKKILSTQRMVATSELYIAI